MTRVLFIYRHGNEISQSLSLSRLIDSRRSKTMVSRIDQPVFEQCARVGIALFLLSLSSFFLERVLERPHDDNRELR